MIVLVAGFSLALASESLVPPSPDDQAQVGSVGINLARRPSSTERSFSNLIGGSHWQVASMPGWPIVPEDRLTREGSVASLRQDEKLALGLSRPAVAGNVRIRCTFEGVGELSIGGAITNAATAPGAISFNWPASYPEPGNVYLTLTRTTPGDPIRNIDCREEGSQRSGTFASEFLQFLRPFGVIRFMEWQNANANPAGRWGKRTSDKAMIHSGEDGVALEDMMELVRETGADPWFTIPWNADEEYVRNFAKHVRANLPRERKVYVELGNEIWNDSFPAGIQARREGLARGLSPNAYEAQLRRYAQKSAWMLRIWTTAFADRPSQLVRVVSSQNVSTWPSETILSYRDTAKFVDALAVAPYFGHGFFSGMPDASARDRNRVSQALRQSVDKAMSDAIANKAVARRFGKRLIAYEAGQHLVGHELVPAINRSPEMYEAYMLFLREWYSRIGDLAVFYSSTTPYQPSGAWGIREYGGQPLAETPKRRAIIDFTNRN